MIKTKTDTEFFLQKRLAYFGLESMSLQSGDMEGVKEKQEKAEKEPMKIEGLVRRSNEILEKHESALLALPARFQSALHDELVQFFHTSTDRFDQDEEKGLNKLEFEAYSQAMLEKIHSVVERYAPIEEEKGASVKVESALETLFETLPEIKDTQFDSSQLETAEGIHTELIKFGKQSEELSRGCRSLMSKVAIFQEAYQQYQKDKTGWSMVIRGLWRDEEGERLQARLEGLKKQLDEQVKALEAKKKEVSQYAREHLNSAGDRLRYREREKRDQLIQENPEEKEAIQEHYAEILKTIDAVDAQVADRVLHQNLETELLLSQVAGQHEFYGEFEIDAPNAWDATIGLLFNRIATGYQLLLVDGLSNTVLDGTSDWLQEKTDGIPVLGISTKVVTNVVLGLPSGVIEGAGELVHGVASVGEHPINTIKGLSTLIPIYNGVNGEWYDFGSAGHSWKEMGKAIIAYDTFAEGNIGKGISKAGLNVILTATGIGALSKGAQGARLAYVTSRAGEASVATSALTALKVGTPIFAADFSENVAKLPGRVAGIPGRVMERLTTLVERIGADVPSMLGFRLAEASDELAEIGKQVEDMTIGGRKASEIEGLAEKTGVELDTMTGEHLVKLGLASRQAIEDFLIYRDTVRQVEKLRSAIALLERQQPLAEIAPELVDLVVLKGEKLDRFIEKLNRLYPEGFKDRAFGILERIGDDVFAFDEAGKLKRYTINKETAQSVLKEIKKADEAVRGRSYELRQECLKASNGQIATYEAYTYAKLEGSWWNHLDYLMNAENWVPERRAFHRELVASEVENALRLSEKMNDAEPTIYMMRGNTASGKTYTARNDERFARAIDEDGRIPGAVNPDTHKPVIAEHELVESGVEFDGDQLHPEARIIADKAIEHARDRNPKLSELWDKRFAGIEEINKMVIEAKSMGKKITMLDIDTPLETSCLRVLNRKEMGSAPITNFNIIADGFESVRANRGALIVLVKSEPTITDYVLYVSDGIGEPTKALEKQSGVVITFDEALVNEALRRSTARDIGRARTILIDQDYIESIPDYLQPGVKKHLQVPPLKLAEAVDLHAN